MEYAIEAIGNAGTCLGILAKDGIVLAAERRNIHKLLDEEEMSEKFYVIDEYAFSVFLFSHFAISSFVKGILFVVFRELLQTLMF